MQRLHIVLHEFDAAFRPIRQFFIPGIDDRVAAGRIEVLTGERGHLVLVERLLRHGRYPHIGSRYLA